MIKITNRTDPLGASINNQQQIITDPLGASINNQQHIITDPLEASINNQQQIITGQLTLQIYIRSNYTASRHDIIEMSVKILLILPEHPRFFQWGSCQYYMYVLQIVVCPFVLFLLAIVLSVDIQILITSLWYLQTLFERKYKRRDIRLIYKLRKTVSFIISL